MTDKKPQRKHIDEQPEQKTDQLTDAELHTVTGGSISLSYGSVVWTYTTQKPD